MWQGNAALTGRPGRPPVPTRACVCLRTHQGDLHGSRLPASIRRAKRRPRAARFVIFSSQLFVADLVSGFPVLDAP
jgi:hypothetical protein